MRGFFHVQAAIPDNPPNTLTDRLLTNTATNTTQLTQAQNSRTSHAKKEKSQGKAMSACIKTLLWNKHRIRGDKIAGSASNLNQRAFAIPVTFPLSQSDQRASFPARRESRDTRMGK